MVKILARYTSFDRVDISDHKAVCGLYVLQLSKGEVDHSAINNTALYNEYAGAAPGGGAGAEMEQPLETYPMR